VHLFMYRSFSSMYDKIQWFAHYRPFQLLLTSVQCPPPQQHAALMSRQASVLRGPDAAARAQSGQKIAFSFQYFAVRFPAAQFLMRRHETRQANTPRRRPNESGSRTAALSPRSTILLLHTSTTAVSRTLSESKNCLCQDWRS